MHNQGEDRENKAVEEKKSAGLDSSRRRITKAGILSPIIMSLSSKPAWAINCTVSGNMSGNASDPAYEEFCSAPGMSPEYWAENTAQWCGPGFSTDDLFNGIINDVTVFDGDPTLLDVVRGNALSVNQSLSSQCKDSGNINNDNYIIRLAQLTVAGWQNALALSFASPPYPYSTEQITGIFLSGITDGSSACGIDSLDSAIRTLEELNNPPPL